MVDGPLVVFVGGGHRIGIGSGDLGELVVLHRVGGDHVHIPGGGILVRVVEAGGIFKVGGGTADFGGLVVHHLDKRLLAPGDRLGQHPGGIAAGGEHQPVEQVDDPHLLARVEPGVRGVHPPEVVEDGIRSGDRLGEVVDVFQHQQAGHDLRQRSRIHRGIGVFLVDDDAGVHVDEVDGGRVDGKADVDGAGGRTAGRPGGFAGRLSRTLPG